MNFTLSGVLRNMQRTFAVAVAGLAFASVAAQDATVKTFKVCALNVDGLPQKILTFDLNANGPGSEGSKKIGQYIAASGIDVLGLSEDFNYNGSLLEGAGSGYQAGTWRGSIAISSESDFDWTKMRFNTDGLQFMVKTDYTFGNETWTAWTDNYGHFTNGADELVTKGYRYYKVNFGQGIEVEFYIMHMDAETDSASNAARASQWRQLRDTILANNSGLPKIVMGDTNSRYTRDNICGLFIDPIVAGGNYTVADAWVEKCKNGEYPALGSAALMVDDLGYTKGEIVDKVFYLNPTQGSVKLTPNSIVFDADNYRGEDGTLLGDHVPVIVEFKAERAAFTPATPADFWRGEAKVNENQHMYLFNVHHKYFISTSSNPTVMDIEEANIWDLNYDADRNTTTLFYKDADSTEYRVVMSSTFGKWSASVKQATSGATNFTFENSTTTEGAYKFVNNSRYFNLSFENGEAKYTAARTASDQNDWLLISETQKQAYLQYAALYEEASNWQGKYDELEAELAAVLQDTKSSDYSRVATDTQKLQAVIDKYEQKAAAITGPAQNASVEATAIYGVGGEQRSTLHRGLNVVRMSDGTVRKLFVK